MLIVPYVILLLVIINNMLQQPCVLQYVNYTQTYAHTLSSLCIKNNIVLHISRILSILIPLFFLQSYNLLIRLIISECGIYDVIIVF